MIVYIHTLNILGSEISSGLSIKRGGCSIVISCSISFNFNGPIATPYRLINDTHILISMTPLRYHIGLSTIHYYERLAK